MFPFNSLTIIESKYTREKKRENPSSTSYESMSTIEWQFTMKKNYKKRKECSKYNYSRNIMLYIWEQW